MQLTSSPCQITIQIHVLTCKIICLGNYMIFPVCCHWFTFFFGLLPLEFQSLKYFKHNGNKTLFFKDVFIKNYKIIMKSQVV